MGMYEELIKIAGAGNVLKDEPMGRHTTFRIGGPADYFVTPADVRALKELISMCAGNSAPYYILGNGSNLLVGDRGFRGVVIQIFKNMDKIEAEGRVIRAQAGALLSRIAAKALENSLTGFEFASGIPGTLGGAVSMNAGAYGGEMKDVIQSVLILTQDGGQRRLSLEELKLGYRRSVIPEKNYVVAEAQLRLEHGDFSRIRGYMEELREKRAAKQPLDVPSAGSTFKRPAGNFAGKLIEDAGLRGFKVGGAMVSDKHCGFVVNTGGATAADVAELMRQVEDRVEALFGVRLEPEIKMIGEF